MVSRRVARLSQAVREVVSTAILFSIRDPRVKNVTVLRVEVAGDVRTAKVFVSVMGTEKERALCLHGLNASRGFLQSKIADRIETRYTPVLKFVLDDAVSSNAEEAARILQELEKERREREGDSDVDRPSIDVESDRVEAGESEVEGFVDVAEDDEE
ncbi:MAG: 30S ribosome-binding factor RbfA [Planctomycetota bacterium]|nr:30S ribosome-binding factor RbfA [Planctomycetota bacterium]MDA0919901.1 30S ribosome-binding factor RbfA [Planctomycetota bacterium]